MNTRPLIRNCAGDDIPALREIYALEVLEGTASFEIVPPSIDEMRRRYVAIAGAGYPFLVAVAEGRIAGYAYASSYRPRPAYRYTAESSVYVARHAYRRGIGSQLLNALIVECRKRGYREMLAVIGDSTHQASIRLHEKAGFRLVGVATGVGYKLDRWLDTVIMQRSTSSHL